MRNLCVTTCTAYSFGHERVTIEVFKDNSTQVKCFIEIVRRSHPYSAWQLRARDGCQLNSLGGDTWQVR